MDRITNTVSRNRTITTPTYPNCSAKIEKMKSVSASGRKLNSFCLLLRNPSPKSPPEPILISDCKIFHFSERD